MKGSRGQASVEMVGFALSLTFMVISIVQVLLFGRAQMTAERIADQAAVLVAEGKPIPRSLRAEAKIELDGRRLTVRVPTPVPLRLGASEAVVTVLVPK
ncbi:MAG: hypothetical protein QOF68_1203 [Gaiellales bacterium]|nr:hypothetical protein [Gaiellales bacterium]